MSTKDDEPRSSAGLGRNRMINQCVFLHQILVSNKEIAVKDIMAAMGMSRRTIDRWLDSFSFVLPLRIERGTVIMEKDELKK